jgi:guanine nucleotide-binding protein alpha-1 subunit
MVSRRGRRRQPELGPEVQEPVADDPLLRALAPPPDETPAQRAVREAREEEARLVSERIDDEIRKEASLRRKTPVKVALLGHGDGASGF